MHCRLLTQYAIIMVQFLAGLRKIKLRAGTQYTRQSLNEKAMHGFNNLSVKPCVLFFIQTLPRILCAWAISRLSFLDLFGPIAGAIITIMLSCLLRIAFRCPMPNSTAFYFLYLIFST